jgi:hypothetical protein
MNKNLPAKPQELIARDIVKAIAMNIGKDVAFHIETMYPLAVSATSRSMLLSVRNAVYNEIMAALDVTDETEILARLQRRKAHRREIKAMMKAGTRGP